MTHLPLVSVALAVYNGEKFLPELLDSVLAQTYSNIEIVAVDDCSSDKSYAILLDYQKKYSNFKVLSNQMNVGYVKNFERAFLATTGEYIAPCDQDDIWHPEKIALLMEEARKGHKAVYCGSAYIDAEGNLTGEKMSDQRRQIDFDNPLMFVVGNSAPGHAMIIHREIINACIPFPESMVHDRWIGFVSTFYGGLKFLDVPLMKYRQHDANVCGGNAEAKKRRKAESADNNELLLARDRMQAFYSKCPDGEWKSVFKQLNDSYRNFSILNNIKRMRLFFTYRDEILAYKKRTALRRWLFCFKMFYKVK